jgi:hypothetical protein
LLEAKRLISDVLGGIHCAQEKLQEFLKQHPLPENSIDDFEMTFETKEARDKKNEAFEKDFYDKHGKEWYEFTEVTPFGKYNSKDDEKD